MRRVFACWLLLYSVVISLPTFSAADPEKRGDRSGDKSPTRETESLAEFYFRYGIVAFSDKGQSVKIDDFVYAEHRKELDFIWQKLRKFPLVSPLQIVLHYKDPYKTQIEDIEWKTSAYNSQYAAVNSLHEYLELSLTDIHKEIELGQSRKALTFSGTMRSDFMKRTTLKSEKLRVAGMTEEIERLIMFYLLKDLTNYAMEPKKIYYFGSRVMPRSEIIKRDPSFKECMPIEDKGITKNAVRVQGLTEISDLEVMVLFSSPACIPQESLRKIATGFKKKFSGVFREFPISLKLIPDQDSCKDGDSFDFINRFYQDTYNKQLSPHQFVKVDFDKYSHDDSPVEGPYNCAPNDYPHR